MEGRISGTFIQKTYQLLSSLLLPNKLMQCIVFLDEPDLTDIRQSNYLRVHPCWLVEYQTKRKCIQTNGHIT